MSKRFQGGILGVGFNPLRAPDAPTGVTGTAGSGQVSVAFTAPTNVGGSAISSYVAISNPGNFSNTGASSPIVVSGLTNGTAYTFQVTALNSYGPSPISAASGSVTPVEPSWMGVLYNASSTSFNAGPLSVDADGSVGFSAFTGSGSSSPSYAFRISSAGAITWQKKIDPGLYTSRMYASAFGPSGYLNLAGTDSSGNTSDALYLTQLNSSGVTQFQVKYLSNANNGITAYGLGLDSSNNLYVAATSPTAATWNMLKFNSSGVYQSSVTTTVSGPNIYALNTNGAVKVASSGDIVRVGGIFQFIACITYNIGLVAYYNSSGALQWSKTYGTSGVTNIGFSDVAIDSSGNVIIVGNNGINGFVIKYDSTGTLLWARSLSSSYMYSVAIDGSGNIYTCGADVNNSPAPIVIAKYNSSGTIQWQRKLGWGNSMGSTYKIALNASGTHFYVSTGSLIVSTRYSFLAKLPTDGSLTGTYSVNGTTATYAASSYTDASITPSGTGYSASTGTTTFNTLTSYPTLTTSTVTSSVTTL